MICKSFFGRPCLVISKALRFKQVGLMHFADKFLWGHPGATKPAELRSKICWAYHPILFGRPRTKPTWWSNTKNPFMSFLSLQCMQAPPASQIMLDELFSPWAIETNASTSKYESLLEPTNALGDMAWKQASARQAGAKNCRAEEGGALGEERHPLTRMDKEDWTKIFGHSLFMPVPSWIRKLPLEKIQNAGASQITPEQWDRQRFDKSAGSEVPGIHLHLIFIDVHICPWSQRQRKNRSREAKRAVSSVLKVTKPVEVQTKGSPGERCHGTCWVFHGFSHQNMWKNGGKIWGESNYNVEGMWFWKEELIMVSSCSFAHFDDFLLLEAIFCWNDLHRQCT